MSLSHLNVHHVRSITHAHLSFNSRYNIIYGANGSGKTSLLEAIYLLGTGHSFRTRDAATLIAHNEPSLTVFGQTQNHDCISLQKTLSGSTLVKLNQKTCGKTSELAHFLPCQVFHQNIFQIIDEGPSTRRSLLDWGLFHVKPGYHEVWKNYKRVVKQRNALLRQKATPQHILPWDKQLANFAEELHVMRTEYFEHWRACYLSILKKLTEFSCDITYYKGWDKKNTNKPLHEILTDQYNIDLQTAYTHSGAHHADILFEFNNIKAKQVTSRGQQKIILIALKLAQANLLTKPCLYLFDDISSELDSEHLNRFLRYLPEINGQFFITSIETNPLLNQLEQSETTCFSVIKGCFT